MGRVDLQVNWLSVDPLVVSCYPGRLRLDFTLNLGEVVESPSRDMKKLCPFLLPCYTLRCVWNVHVVPIWPIVTVARQVDELQNQRPASDDSATSGEEVSADNVLEYGGLSR